MTIENIAPGANEDFFDDLFEPAGSPNQDHRRRSDPAYALMKASLDVFAARINLSAFPKRWPRLVRWRGMSLDDKFELIRAVEWHYGYVFRERVRMLLNEVLRHVPKESVLADNIQTAIKDFKKRTDPSFTARGKHIHNFPLHDPLASQATTLELLYQILWSKTKDLEPQIRSYVRGRRQIATRTLREELIKMHNDLMEDGDQAVGSIVQVYRELLPKWPHASPKAKT
jgi:hypothetical protein